MTVTLRSEKSEVLTIAEMDENFREVRNVERGFFLTLGAAAGETVWSYAPAKPLRFPMGLPSSVAVSISDVPFTGSFSLRLNGGEIGTIDFVDGSATFTFPSDIDTVPGSELSLVAADDYDYERIAITFFVQLT